MTDTGARKTAEKAFDFEAHCGELGDAPRFRLLSDKKLQRIHEASLEVLEDVGLKVTTEEALQLLVDAGSTVSDENIVRIPRRLVENAIQSAPKQITIYDRQGQEALLLEGKNTYFGLGITAIHIRDWKSGERRDAQIEDVALVCRVA
ncbi:MAG: trimethylamine methyltransferase family protein, partial [Dehalococcoidia bacterium]